MYSLDVLRFLLFFLRKISNDVILLDSVFQVAGKPAYSECPMNLFNRGRYKKNPFCKVC